MPRVHVRAGASVAMEAGAATPQGPGEAAAVGAARGCGRVAEGDEALPLRVRLGRERARRRAGPGTPAPSWKLEASPGPEEEGREGEPLPVAAARRSSVAAAAAASVSARQLGASLWEIHNVTREGRRGGWRRRRSGRGLAGGDGVEVGQSSCGFGRNLADSSADHKLHQERSHTAQPVSPASYTSSIGDSSIHQPISPARSLDVKGGSRGAGYSLKTSTELLKVLNRIWSLEGQHTSNMSVIKGLKLELQQAHAHIEELMQERLGYRHEVASLMRELSEDKIAQKKKDQEKIEAALHSLRDELQDERRLRRHSENLHKKFGKELSEIKSAFLKAVKDLEKEKKANCLFEDLCDQLTMGIRNYEEEVRFLKQKHAGNCEHKFDKSVLHISEAWLDERMQMQNIDVKEDVLQNSTITDRLSSEIQAFLLSKKSSSSNNNDKFMKDACLRRQSLESVYLNGATSAPQLAEDDDDSVASDLHCFELNMHGNVTQGHHPIGCRSGTRSMDAPNKRSAYSHGIAAESSQMSHVPIYAQKDKVRPSSSKPQHVTRTPEIGSRSNAGITSAEEKSEIISRGSQIDSSKHNLEGSRAECLGQESLDRYSRTSLFCEGTTSGDFLSPARQPNYQSTTLGHEIFECPPELPAGVKEHTLKAKLLQARLEGRHARLKAPGGPLSSRRK